MIVDCHTHLWDKANIGRPFIDEVRGAGGAAIDLASDPNTHRRGTGRADVVFVFAFHAPHIGVAVPNDFVADYVKSEPDRLVGYLSVDPTQSEALPELDRAVSELGLRGLKLVPTYQNYHPLDERAFAVYERAEQLDLPVTFHMGTTPHPTAPLEYGRPLHIDQIARLFPDLRIVIAHVAHPWEPEALVVIRKHPRVYADISALVYRPFQLYHTLRLAIEYDVDKKLLFGSDFPWRTTAQTLDGLRHLATKSADIDKPLESDVIEGIVHRDTVALLGLNTERQP